MIALRPTVKAFIKRQNRASGDSRMDFASNHTKW
ncbi:hypothetical protein BJ928_13723 [Rhizobium sp. WW_1]|nr:hypothetical protein BJ928_13723 [Rhizobium sp. WW_1]